jgi:Phage terminase large subunit (GpA)
MTSNPTLNFCRRLVYLKDKLIHFDGRPYLPAIFASTARNLVLRASRQVEKSTFLALKILFLAATCPGIQLLYVCPRDEQARIFVHSKLMPLLDQSPLLRQALLGNVRRKPPVRHMRFANGSQLYVRAAFRSADAVRGISADVLLIDEFQDIAGGDLPVLQETLSHAERGVTVLAGTPKLDDNHLQEMFNKSTSNEWMTTCSGCGKTVVPDEHCLGPTGIACPQCQASLDLSTGRWVPRNPDATWGDGFWINYMMVPWAQNYDQLLERQRVYDFARFRNEVLGQPVSLGDHLVTLAELEACSTNKPMAQSIEDIPVQFRSNIVAGVDWGAGGTARTVIVVGFACPDAVFEVCHFARFRGDEDPDRVRTQVAEVCTKFQVRWIGADGGGNGTVYNRLLLDSLPYKTYLYGILYSAADAKPYQDGILWKWTVDRTGSIGYLFSCVKKQKIQFPRAQDCRGFLDEFACEVAELDDISRRMKFSHPSTHPDDAMHAANYALLIATRGFPGIAEAEDM